MTEQIPTNQMDPASKKRGRQTQVSTPLPLVITTWQILTYSTNQAMTKIIAPTADQYSVATSLAIKFKGAVIQNRQDSPKFPWLFMLTEEEDLARVRNTWLQVWGRNE